MSAAKLEVDAIKDGEILKVPSKPKSGSVIVQAEIWKWDDKCMVAIELTQNKQALSSKLLAFLD